MVPVTVFISKNENYEFVTDWGSDVPRITLDEERGLMWRAKNTSQYAVRS